MDVIRDWNVSKWCPYMMYVCAYMYVCMYICVIECGQGLRVCTCTFIYIRYRRHVWKHTSLHHARNYIHTTYILYSYIHIHIHTQTRTHTYMHAFMSTYMRTLMQLSSTLQQGGVVWSVIYMHTYIHTHLDASWLHATARGCPLNNTISLCARVKPVSPRRAIIFTECLETIRPSKVWVTFTPTTDLASTWCISIMCVWICMCWTYLNVHV